ncbi:MAG: hydantoinase B/oxoprolinase family protein, partial [Cyanobacteria bacterium J06632_3]
MSEYDIPSNPSSNLLSNPSSNPGWQFWIDRGGTFTDIVAQRPDGTTVLHKLLSENPARYEDAPIQGMRELMGLGSDQQLPGAQISSIKMGTTVATNALLERKGDRTLFIATKGFRDGLRIGYQNRPDIFALQIVLPEMLYDKVVEVPLRVSADGQVLEDMTPAIKSQLLNELEAAYKTGIRSCAISLLHSYRYSAHEKQVAQLAAQIGFTQISASHEVSPLIKWVSRSDTTVVDAYLSPILRRYVDRIEKAIDTRQGHIPQILFMQSNGGLTPARHFQGKDSILSGPAGGIVGAVKTSLTAGFDKIITFDMGGTSTDVAHYKAEVKTSTGTPDSQQDSPDYERAFETEVAGVRLRSPMMAIHTVAAGGGSILGFDGERYQVGPASAGAFPGPACYRNGGELTVTDCNVLVGKIQPQFFPQVFGPNGDQPIDRDIVVSKFSALANDITAATGDTRDAEQVAEGFLTIAIDNMANAIKKISVQKGYDITNYALCCFGAAGGQHACRLAESLGMKTIFVHPYAGVLSAYGMGLAERRVLKECAVEVTLSAEAMAQLKAQMTALSQQAVDALNAQGTTDITSIEVLQQLHVRYAGNDATLTVRFDELEAIQQQFEQRYLQRYGITLPNKALIVSNMTAEAIGKTGMSELSVNNASTNSANANNANNIEQNTPSASEPLTTVRLFSGNQWHNTLVLERDRLHPSQRIAGPAIILEKTGTNIVEPGWVATINEDLALVLIHQRDETVESQETIQQSTQSEREVANELSLSKPDPVKLEIFNNLFQAIAQQMGITLQNTSSSVNIKERLDFSCAIFDAQGQLIANAPHIPVHLGSMGESVTALIASYPNAFSPGDTFISNNPYNGGTHLPDITAITPVFIPDDLLSVSSQPTTVHKPDRKPLFFVASRGHHADIGGITPGSMPPHSTTLIQEGILLDNFKLVDQGKLQERALRQHLSQSLHPARNPDQNLADLQAQIAANNKGVQELHRMVQQFGLGTVQAYMQHVQNNAEQAVRKVIADLARQHGSRPATCQVQMDCGATIKVSVSFAPEAALASNTQIADNQIADSQIGNNQIGDNQISDSQIATIDFSGTSIQQSNNFNAPLAVCKAAVLYVFRTLVNSPIPLNAGCLKPLAILVPQGCILNPTFPAAVVAGNVETSQA